MVNSKPSAKSGFPPLLYLTYDLQHLADRALVPDGVGLSQARIMSGLNMSSARSQRHLAAELHQTESNISRQLQVMKKHGLVSVRRNKKDHRVREVKLTSKGARVYKQAVKALAGQQKSLLKLLDQKDIKAFERASGHLLVSLNVKSGTKRKFAS